MQAHTHYRQRNAICIDCKAQLCTHHHKNLRGCMLDRGHTGPHHNPNVNPDLSAFTHWEDSDGTYINSKSDWVGLVNSIGKPDKVN